MKEISQKEKETLFNFIERTIDMSADDLDEGIGTVYERIVIDEYFKRIKFKYNINTVLETPADGVTGVPGLNSLEFARNGAKVFQANPSQKMLDKAKKIWDKKGLGDFVEFHKSEIDDLPFEDNSFDLVWNYCMFERFEHPEVMLEIMKKVSKKYVMVMTQNFWNLGTFVHWLFHKYHKLEWDHGYTKFMKLSGIKKVLKKADLKILEIGMIDTPPWMDTWDMPLRGEIKKILSPLGMKWNWSIGSGDEKDSKGGTISFFSKIEKWLPRWFNKLQTHHYYVLCEKNS